VDEDNFSAVVWGEVEGRIVNLERDYPGGRAKSGSFRLVSWLSQGEKI